MSDLGFAPLFPPINAVEFVEDRGLIGAKRAFMLDGVMHVSPAMLSLMRSASPEELERLLGTITYVDLGKSDRFTDQMTQPAFEEIISKLPPLRPWNK